MRYRGGGVGHRAIREATNSFLKDRPREELVARWKSAGAKTDTRAAKDKNGPGDGESEDEQAEPALRTEQINPEDIPMGDEISVTTKVSLMTRMRTRTVRWMTRQDMQNSESGGLAFSTHHQC